MDAFEAMCRRLIDATALTWEWDGRFGMAVAAFEAGRAADIEAALVANVGPRVTAADLPTASGRVRDAAKALGGLRASQAIFASSDDDPVMAVCPWWPWGGGDRISVRVGYDAGRDIVAAGRLDREFKSWFSL